MNCLQVTPLLFLNNSVGWKVKEFYFQPRDGLPMDKKESATATMKKTLDL